MPRKSQFPALVQGLSIKLKFTQMTEKKKILISLCSLYVLQGFWDTERSGLEENNSKDRPSYLQVEKGRKQP